ncbi:response regulator [Sphingomonas panaciterrae]|uniref:response regulator n=1 Tax=Sphingomonas panaciterrae TaxID=1462999 RepID=UPI002FF220F1
MLRDRRVLVVEDEYFIADAMQRGLKKEGAIVLGPAPSVAEALALIDSQPVDAAILDLNLGDEKAFPVADVLQARDIPFLFTTGYDASDVPPAWRHVPRLEKPVEVATIVRALRSAGEDAL